MCLTRSADSCELFGVHCHLHCLLLQSHFSRKHFSLGCRDLDWIYLATETSTRNLFCNTQNGSFLPLNCVPSSSIGAPIHEPKTQRTPNAATPTTCLAAMFVCDVSVLVELEWKITKSMLSIPGVFKQKILDVTIFALF